MRAIVWAVVVLAIVVGAASWWLGPGWNLGQAMAMSTILMVMTSVVMIVIDRLRPLGESEF